MAGDWVEIVETTTSNYLREVEDLIVRNRKLLAMLQARGQITFNVGGKDLDWKVKYRRNVPQGYTDMQTQTYPKFARHKSAKLGWRAYAMSETVSKKDRLQNRGAAAIVNLLGEKLDSMTEDFEDFFGDELYVDGDASGNEKRMHGIESMMGYSGISTVAPVALPSDTYASINTDLGYYGGAWTTSTGVTTWPTGRGSAEYDFFSPLLVDYTNALWSATTKTWVNTAQEALRYGIIKSKKNKSATGSLDFILLNDELFRLWLNLQDTKTRITVQQGTGAPGTNLTGLGFGDVFWFEGAELTYEYGMPENTGYGFNIDHMELVSMQDRLFVPTGPWEHPQNKTINFDIDFYGNMKFDSPKWFVKWFNYS
jgi:hypothetical protein